MKSTLAHSRPREELGQLLLISILILRHGFPPEYVRHEDLGRSGGSEMRRKDVRALFRGSATLLTMECIGHHHRRLPKTDDQLKVKPLRTAGTHQNPKMSYITTTACLDPSLPV